MLQGILYSLKVEDRIELAHMPVVLTLGKPRDKVFEFAPQLMDKNCMGPNERIRLFVSSEFGTGATFLSKSLKRD